MKKETKDYAMDISMTAIIMADDGRLQEIYKKNNEEWGVGGYMDTLSVFSTWAMEFEEEFRDTDWEELLFDDTGENYKARSKKFDGLLACWDDVVMDYAQHKLENYTKEEFNRVVYNS